MSFWYRYITALRFCCGMIGAFASILALLSLAINGGTIGTLASLMLGPFVLGFFLAISAP